MSDQLSSRVRTLYQIGNVSVKQMLNKRKYPHLSKFSRATLYQHAVRPLDEVTVIVDITILECLKSEMSEMFEASSAKSKF